MRSYLRGCARHNIPNFSRDESRIHKCPKIVIAAPLPSWHTFAMDPMPPTPQFSGNPPPAAASPGGSDKPWAVLGHLSLFVGLPFLLPLVIYLVMRKESDYV